MRVLAEYLLPLVQIGGKMLAQKGESGPAEVHSAENAIKLLGGEVRQLVPVTLPGVVEDVLEEYQEAQPEFAEMKADVNRQGAIV